MPVFVLAVAVGLASLLASAGRAQQEATFSSVANLVVLHASVRDGNGRPVPGLGQAAFRVWDNDRLQPVTVFSNEDEPVTVGLLIDSSASMLMLRERVLAGAMAFVENSHQGSELFALAFNERVRPALPVEAPFTTQPAVLRGSLEGVVGSRGKTALYDAIDAGVRYAARGQHQRRFLIVISDGSDNASRRSRAEVTAIVRSSDVVIHAVALSDPVEPANPKVLRQLATESGGQFLEPKNNEKIAPLLRELATDIRHAYLLGFVPDRPSDGQYHRLRVQANADRKRLHVRTRDGYMARPREAGNDGR